MVDISYLGISGKEISEEMRPALLDAPFIPFDGLNDQGLAVGMMAVPHAEGGEDPRKVTISDLSAIRLILDYASNLSEAIALLQDFNIDFGQGPPLHFLVSDAAGDSAVIEFIDGQVLVIEGVDTWQVSTNFLFSEEKPVGAGSSCWRYNKAYTALQEADGNLSMSNALLVLKDLSQSGSYPTIWSVVYNLTSKEIELVVGKEYSTIYKFNLNNE
jgi:predicted choloylglycine hydrolase